MRLLPYVLLALGFAAAAALADTKITDLPLGSAASSGTQSVVPYVDTGTNITKKLKLSDFPNIPAFQGWTLSRTLTGFVSSSGSVSSADTVLTALEKLNGNSTPGAPVSMGTFDGQAATATGASITSNVLYNQSADATHPGMLNTGTQTIAGVKTFSSTITGATSGNEVPLTFSAPLSRTTNTISCITATGSVAGCLSAADWTTFNAKQAALSFGALSDAGTDGITVTGGSGAVIGSGTSLAQHVADSTHNGYLSSTDWSTFNGKQASGSYITALTSDVTASGPGSAVATISTNVVTNAKLATMANGTFKCRTSAGTGNAEDCTATQATAILNAFTGDSGSGGVKGLVPAPASGDGAAGKVLKADGTWGTAGTTSPLTTKGDIYVYSTTNARQPIGTDGYVLTADSTKTTGMDWKASTGGSGLNVARFVLGGAVVPFTAIDGSEYVSGTQTLSSVNISALNSGTSGSTTVQLNQYRSGALQASQTASLNANSGLPNGAAAALSGSLSLLAGDVITVDVVSAATGASDLTVEWGTATQATGGATLTLVTKTTSYTLTNSDDTVIFNCSAACSATFQTSASATNKIYRVKNVSAYPLSLVLQGSDAFEDGTTSGTINPGSAPYPAAKFQPDGGTKWYAF